MFSKLSTAFLAALVGMSGVYVLAATCPTGKELYCCDSVFLGGGGGVNCQPYDSGDDCGGEIICCAGSESFIAYDCVAPQ